MARFASLLFTGVLTSAAVVVGCATQDPTTTDTSAVGGPHRADHDNPNNLDGCVKVEGAQIGEVGLQVTLDGETVTFTSWVAKQGEASEYVGFTLSDTATFVVKAGQDSFEGSGTSWVNPNGTSGPTAKGISNIQICAIGDDDGDGACGGEGQPACPPTCGGEGQPACCGHDGEPACTPDCGGAGQPACPPADCSCSCEEDDGDDDGTIAHDHDGDGDEDACHHDECTTCQVCPA